MVVAGALAAACADGPPEHRFETRDEAGVVIARTTGGPLHSEDPFAFEHVLTLRQERAESLLYRPADVQRGPDGRYYVVDAGNARIAVFGADGGYEHAIGGPGQGPGELGNAISLATLEPDRVGIFDSDQQRLTYYRLDGTLIEVVRLPGETHAEAVRVGPDNTILLTTWSWEVAGIVRSQSERLTIVNGEDWQASAEIATAAVPTMVMKESELQGVAVAVVSMTMPYTGRPMVVPAGEHGIVAMRGDVPELAWYGYAGELLRRASVELPSVAVTTARRTAYARRWARQLEGSAARGNPQGFPMPDLEFPEVAGAWSWLAVDDDGRVWLEDVVAAAERAPGSPARFYVLDAEGRHLAMTDVPLSRFRIDGESLFGVHEDFDSGEVGVRVYELRERRP